MYEIKDSDGKVLQIVDHKPTAEDLLYTLFREQVETNKLLWANNKLLKTIDQGIGMIAETFGNEASHDDLAELTKAVQEVERAVSEVSDTVNACSDHWQLLTEKPPKNGSKHTGNGSKSAQKHAKAPL